MEEKTNLVESLINRAEEYGKTSIELLKLKAIDKSSDVVSSFIPTLAVILFISLFTLILNIGLALWIGELLGKLYYGFFVIAAFYGITGIVFHFVIHKWLKRRISNAYIRRLLK
ncbi:MAG: hypothetical protein Q8862_07580 [Bacteroidota bacterium]|nr:hypothetical protein [Bacteroidota bacterium]MDP4205964.1 hypothetical protein [Bacteroidota bacterium]